MTAKEKANELVNKFYLQRSKDNLPLTIYWTSAIGCALIAVDEILDQWEYYPHIPEEGLFWQEVKQEIEKI